MSSYKLNATNFPQITNNMPAAKKYKIDDIVYAKWPGSSQYYKAIIVEAAEDALHFDVKFESDDSLETVPKKHLMVCISFYEYSVRASARAYVVFYSSLRHLKKLVFLPLIATFIMK